jgi:hypothetical protein
MSWDFNRDDEYLRNVDEIKKLLLKIDEPVKDALLAELLVMHHKHHSKKIISEIIKTVSLERTT